METKVLPFYVKFDYKDFYFDLSSVDCALVGAWIKILCLLWEKGSPYTAPLSEWATTIHEPPETTLDTLLKLAEKSIADVTCPTYGGTQCPTMEGRPVPQNRPGPVPLDVTQPVTVSCRRITRDCKMRDLNKLRKRRYRDKIRGHAPCPTTGHAPKTSQNNHEGTPCLFDNRIEQNRIEDINPPSPHENDAQDQPKNTTADQDHKPTKKTRKARTPKTPGNGSGRHHLFDSFWEKYPRKKQVAEALKAFNKLDPTPELVRIIQTDIFKRLRLDDEWIRDIIPRASTYLNQKLWTDEIRPVRSKNFGEGSLKWTPPTTETK
jgi:hypothetical protein